MTTLYRWGLEAFCGGFRAYGHIYGHRVLTDGHYISTSLIQDAAVVDGQLVLQTQSGTVYTLWPEDIRPKLRPDSAYPDAWKEALACLSSFGIDAGFAEHCVQARIDADARRRAAEERMLEPGELREVLPTLCRPGPMFCFEKSAFWEGGTAQALETLCNDLDKEVIAGRARFGESLWVFVQLVCSLNIGWEYVERCLELLAGTGKRRNYLRFQFEFPGSLPDNTLKVRGLIGAWDGVGKAG